MRKTFLETLTKLAEKDPRVILVIGDVGFSFVEAFKERFPKQFLNTGAMEQAMMGIAVGLANAGWKPVVYTMRNFTAFRPYEQVRNDIAFANTNVKIFGVTGSAAYKFLGISHNVLQYKNGKDEDVAMFEELPNIKVYSKQTPDELAVSMVEEYGRQGPAYFLL